MTSLVRGRVPLIVLLVALPLLVVPSLGGTAAAAPAPPVLCTDGPPQVRVADPAHRRHRGFDITAMGLWNGPDDACVWTTVAGRFTPDRAQVLQVLFDTDGRDGPEFYAFAYSPRDGDHRTGARLAVRTDDGGWSYVGCEVGRFFRVARNQLGLGVPQGCLGDPDRVRVKVQVWDVRRFGEQHTWTGRADQVPNRRWSPAA